MSKVLTNYLAPALLAGKSLATGGRDPSKVLGEELIASVCVGYHLLLGIGEEEALPPPEVGICPHCERRSGPVGEGCPSEGCLGRYHFIPRPWFDSAKEFAHRKGQPIDPFLGRRLDRYLLAGKLGQGGMGAVYLAFQEPLHREVALKVISGIEMTEAGRGRFEREARAVSILDHPNIVKLYDYGIARIEFEVPYMALEYVKHGRTLRRALGEVREQTGGLIPGEVVLAIFKQILHALSAAHDLGIVHRDMKPDNVMVVSVHGNPYFVKVLDFGLAKAVQDLSGFDGTVSRTGQILGTPYYMAPEQASGRLVDARADLYAVATMLFEVFTGSVPFDGTSSLEILVKKSDPRWWPMDRPGVRRLPKALQDLLSRGLQPKPEDRFQNASEMLAALEDALSGRRATAMGLDRRASGSSQDRPVTPPTPAPVAPAESNGQALEPTRPMGGLAASESPPQSEGFESGGTIRALGRRGRPPAWAWVAVSVVAALVGVGGVWLLGGRGGGEEVGPLPAQAVGTSQGQSGALGSTAQSAAPTSPADAVEGPGAQVASARSPIAHEATPPSPPSVHRFSFEIRTAPPGAEVQVEGKRLGTAPLRYEFQAHFDQDLDRVVRIEAARPGYRTVSMDVRLRDAVARGWVEMALKKAPVKPAPPPPKMPGRKFHLK